MQTYHGYQWQLNKTRTASGEGKLCGPGWLHAYESPLLAVLHQPIHVHFSDPRLFRGMASGKIYRDGGMKIGVQSLMLQEELPLPVITQEQRIRYAIRCAWAVSADAGWQQWAKQWIDGRDRSAVAASTAWAATKMRAARVAAWAATMNAASATAMKAARTGKKDELPLSQYAEWALTAQPLPSPFMKRREKK